jgi:hypothetical protein
MVVKKNKEKEEKVPKNPLTCSREVLNYSTIERSDRFDKPTFNPEKFIEKIHTSSPKLEAMLRKIEALDKQDYLIHRKLYKHYIFTDIKKGYGAKIIASAMIAAGYIPVIKPQGSRIVLDEKALAMKSDSKFAILSSTSLWNATTTTKSTKEILTAFNKSPENIYGNDVRFIVLDSGFKEGVDLLNVRYSHIFESQLDNSSLVQAIGRGTRFCGQKDLRFNNGWDLKVFNYKSITNEGFFKKLANKVLFRKDKSIVRTLQERDSSLNKRMITESALTELLKENSVDKYLNENINGLKDASDNSEYIIAGTALATAAVAGTLIYQRTQKKN